MDVQSILSKRAEKLLGGTEKAAFQPMPGGQPPMGPPMGGGGGMPAGPGGGAPGQMPQPAPGGAGQMPPMDPSMAGGTAAPVDPMTGMPMDPSMAGPEPVDISAMPIAELTVGDLKQMIREVVADVITGGPTDEAAADKKDTGADLEAKVDMLIDALGLSPDMASAPGEMVGSGGAMGAGAGMPIPAGGGGGGGQEVQASTGQQKDLADMIIECAVNAK